MLDSKKIGCALALVVGSVSATPAHAHFILVTPEANQEQGDSGGPQKVGPCGGQLVPFETETVVPTGKVTEYHAGDTVHVTWNIAVDHAGYFRIALAEDPADFVDPTFTDASACTYDDATVQKGTHDNLLMDGIDATATEQDVVIPDMPCEKCTLQVTQVMKGHGPPNCIYYHCADIKILPKGGSGTDGGVSGNGGSGGAAAGTGGVGSGGKGGAAGSGGSTSVGSGGKGGSGAAGTTSTATGGATAKPAGSGGMPAVSGTGGNAVSIDAVDKDDGGCAVTRPGAAAREQALLVMFGLAFTAFGVRRRRGN